MIALTYTTSILELETRDSLSPEILGYRIRPYLRNKGQFVKNWYVYVIQYYSRQHAAYNEYMI